MQTLKIPIIPERQIFCKNENATGLNLKAICVFVSTGFFLGKDSYFKNQEALQPAVDYSIDENGFIKTSKPYWHWHYTPAEISLRQATEEFAHLFEKITGRSTEGRDVILPLSGGLDSRTQATALENGGNVRSYSYRFEGGFDETKYGMEMAKLKSFEFTGYTVSKGYLWKEIDKLADSNLCYADFTHPRQMAVIDRISKLGNVFYLGHWGDVLFDDMGVEDNLTDKELSKIVKNKILKQSGTELAESLWKCWGLEGSFDDYIDERLSELLDKIKIENVNSKIRAFKSLYWAPRWTSANLNVFSDKHPLALPYYDDEMCRFICTIPEKHLSGRQIQIEYIKMKNPGLAEIPWQSYEPKNLYNYKEYESSKMLPSRIIKRGKRMIREKVLNRRTVRRNWELQFLGEDNDKKLREHLFENKSFAEFIPQEITREFYEKFSNKDKAYYSHPLSMLLTLSVFSRKFKDKTG